MWYVYFECLYLSFICAIYMVVYLCFMIYN